MREESKTQVALKTYPVVVRNTEFVTTGVVSPLRTSSPPPVISTSGSEKHRVCDFWTTPVVTNSVFLTTTWSISPVVDC
jgi:hypothetical protein